MRAALAQLDGPLALEFAKSEDDDDIRVIYTSSVSGRIRRFTEAAALFDLGSHTAASVLDKDPSIAARVVSLHLLSSM